MGYKSEKQLQADYLEVIRKNRERESQNYHRRKKRRERTRDTVIVLIAVIIWLLASHYTLKFRG